MSDLDEWRRRHPQAAAELAYILQFPLPVTSLPGGTSEAATQAQIRVEASRLGFAMWRNNNGACKDDTGRMIRFGLGNDSERLNKVWKSADLIGIGPGGRFVACEVKRPGWQRPENDRDRAQEAMLLQVNQLGGIGFFATHPQHYIERVK